MKRKFSEISKPEYLLCDICSTPVYNYEECTQPFTYCSRECYEVLVLSQKNDYLDVQDKIKRVKSEEDLMSIDINDPDKMFCSICSTVHSVADRRWCEAVEEYERQASYGSV